MTPAIYQLYTIGLSPYGQRVSMTLALKGLTQITDIIETFGGTDELKALSPIAKIPLLITAQGPVPESMVIVRYLDAKHAEPRLASGNPDLLAKELLVSQVVDLYLAPHTITLIRAMRGHLPEAEIKAATSDWVHGLSLAEHYISPSAFAVGETLSTADIALAPFLHYVTLLADWHKLDDPLANCPKALSLLKHYSNHSAIKTAFDEIDIAFASRCEALSQT